MKMSELQNLSNKIESESNRKIKLIGSVCSGRPIVYLYFNGSFVKTLWIDEIRNELINIRQILTVLSFGDNPVEF